MNSINQLRNYISRKKQCVSLNPSQLSLDSVNCVYSCEEGVSSKKKKKKIDFLPSFFASLFHRNIPSLSLLPSFTRLFPSPSLICFSSSPLFFPFVQSLSPSSSLFLLLILLSFSIPPSCFFHSLTSKCFVRANFNENRVITREVQGTKGKTDARSKKKRVGDPR